MSIFKDSYFLLAVGRTITLQIQISSQLNEQQLANLALKEAKNATDRWQGYVSVF